MENPAGQPGSSSQFGVCSICTDSCSGDSEITSTKCGHIYHKSCISKWLENSTICPVCRTAIVIEDLIRIYPGSDEKSAMVTAAGNTAEDGTAQDGTAQDGTAGKDEVPTATSHPSQRAEAISSSDTLLTEQELESLTSDAFRHQNIVYTQLAILGRKLAEQTTYIETLKAKLEDSDNRYKYEKGEKETLRKNLAEATESLDELQIVTTEMRSENDVLSSQLGKIDATMEYMDSLVEQHKSDYMVARDRITELEDEMGRIQQECGAVAETFDRIQLIRDEVEVGEESNRSVEDFIEDIIAENVKLKAEIKESERSIETKEYIILDLELNLNGLRETMKEIQSSYADQSSESKEMEVALRTMQRLYKEQTEELDSLKSERDLYEKDVKDMIGSLKRSESVKVEIEAQRRQSEMLNQTYEGELAQLKAILGRIEKEKQDAVMMVQLKEDVILSLQESIKSTTDTYFKKLEALGIVEANEETSNADALTLLDARFKIISEEIEKKENLVMHFMTEQNSTNTKDAYNEEDVLNSVAMDITITEMRDKIDEMTDKAAKLLRDVRKKENQIEEKELIISHLVNVINRYAYNDRIENIEKRNSRLSDATGTMDTLSVSNSTQSDKNNQNNKSRSSNLSRMFKRSGSSASSRSVQ